MAFDNQPSTSVFHGLLRWLGVKPKRRLLLPTNPSVSLTPGHITSIISRRVGAWDLIAETAGGPDEQAPSVQIRYRKATDAFDAVRSALQSTEKMFDLEQRVGRLVAEANRAAAIGQDGLRDDLFEVAGGLVLEQQAVALGHNRWVERGVVDAVVKATAKEHNLTLAPLSQFPRTVPNSVHELLLKRNSVFSSYWILYTNPTNEKVKERDPIAFGKLSPFPDRLYFVVDWVDEYCGLTMEKFIHIGQDVLHADWRLHEVPTPSGMDLDALAQYARGQLQPKRRNWFQRLWSRRSSSITFSGGS